MLVFPNVKINLGLRVTHRLPDGYRALQTCFVPVPAYADALEILPVRAGQTETTLTCTGIPIPGDAADNLVLKAYHLLAGSFGALPPVRMLLHKAIAPGSGVGAGSADAARALVALRDYFSIEIDDTALAKLAAKLGADCPFFIYNRPLLAMGKGEIFAEPPAALVVTLARVRIKIVFLGIHVATREAFAGLTPQVPGRSVAEVLVQPIDTWREELMNDFEGTVFARYPAIAAAKAQLYDEGALYASMSGSGSAVYGLFAL